MIRPSCVGLGSTVSGCGGEDGVHYNPSSGVGNLLTFLGYDSPYMVPICSQRSTFKGSIGSRV